MPDRWDWLTEELRVWAAGGLLRRRREIRPLAEGRCWVDGHVAWDFASNDYLGLATHPSVVQAAMSALETHGVGAKASPLVCGRSDEHVRLEQALAEFEGTEAAIVFPTGMAANVGTVAALASEGDSVFCDRLNHASLVDGCRLSGARLRVYRHDDLDGLSRSLARESSRRRFIVTDSVFSMDGDLAPLPELCAIRDRYGAILIVDEAHGTGVFGQSGRGVGEMLDVEERIDVRIGTLSKAIGALGGFVAGRRELIEFLWNKARTQIYSTALPPAICAAATAALQVIRADSTGRDRLLQRSAAFRNALVRSGIVPYPHSVGPIVPVVLHAPEAAIEVSDSLLKNGFLVGAIRPPTVPQGTSRLRITLHAATPDNALESFVAILAETCAGRV
ncbi:8-amino-7-oxononanoate synthase [Schlesneria paludicola]|uniref:8-amino-7-oxononanoate synthase n=1 Tax=Schlesneria paludicola TaxID=360056 RepID=UPI00029AEA15|nr:8-amino-7-oxononanoate synthase [Schlesneria paludicola]